MRVWFRVSIYHQPRPFGSPLFCKAGRGYLPLKITMAARFVEFFAVIAVVVHALWIWFAHTDPRAISSIVLPNVSSPVVLRERNDLRSFVDFQALANNFRTLDVLAKDASQESNNFGDAALKSHINGLVSEVSGLISKSGSTVGSFKGTSEAALNWLTVAFRSIIDGDSEKAIERLQNVSELAQNTAQQAVELQTDSDKNGESAQKVLAEVLTAQEDAKQKKAALEEKQRELEVSKRGMEELARSAQEAERRAQEMARQADEAAARARKKRKKKKKGWKRIGHSLKKLAGHDDTKKYKDLERAAREEAQKFNEQRQAHQNKYDQAQREIQELEILIANVQLDANRVASTINTLHKLTGTFKSLSATTHKIVGVWERLQLLCEDLQNALLNKYVEETTPDSPADREAVWSSSFFQAKAVQLYARWLALQEESMNYFQASNQILHEEPP